MITASEIKKVDRAASKLSLREERLERDIGRLTNSILVLEDMIRCKRAALTKIRRHRTVVLNFNLPLVDEPRATAEAVPQCQS